MVRRDLVVVRRLFSSIRRPLLGDYVILSNGIEEKNGLYKDQIVKVISYDKNDIKMCYRVSLPSSHYSAWFAESDLNLSNPNAPIPKPEPPESNECCGSECPDCVWITYWETLQEWERTNQNKG